MIINMFNTLCNTIGIVFMCFLGLFLVLLLLALIFVGRCPKCGALRQDELIGGLCKSSCRRCGIPLEYYRRKPDLFDHKQVEYREETKTTHNPIKALYLYIKYF